MTSASELHSSRGKTWFAVKHSAMQLLDSPSSETKGDLMSVSPTQFAIHVPYVVGVPTISGTH